MNAPTPIAASRWYSAAAIFFGIVTTYAILQYSINNLDLLGLSPETKKVRSLEIYIFVFGHVFIFFILGKLAYSHPEWAFKLTVLGIAIALFDFAGTYQARLGIFQQQTLTQTAQKSHADLIASQIGVNQNAAKELSDSAARQRANKLITGSAQTAMNAGKQADAGNKLVAEHAAAIKEIRPTEADTWGEWASTKVFLGAVLLHVFNLMMWGVAGALSGGNEQGSPFALMPPVPPPAAPPTQTPAPERSGIATPHCSDSATPPAVTFDLEKAREAVRRKSAIEQMPKVMPWHFAVPAAIAATGAAQAAEAPKPPTPAPADATPKATPAQGETVAESLQQVKQNRYTKATPKKAGKQMDTGTKGKAAGRYERLKKMVIVGQVKPSINALYALDGEHVSKPTAREYLEAMERDGIVKKHGKGWVLV